MKPQMMIQDYSISMEERINIPPELLKRSAGSKICSIFRAPQSLIDINEKAYHPCIVSIGPFHHGQPNLRMIEEHKWRFLDNFLTRARTHGVSLDRLKATVISKESLIRESYAEHIRFGSAKLVEVMVLDGCFILELFFKVSNIGQELPELDDPIFSLPWIFPFLMRDFLRLENQIPFFVLDDLFKLSSPLTGTSTGNTVNSSRLNELALKFFNYAVERPQEVLQGQQSFKAQHLLDLFRQSFIPLGAPEPKETIDSSPFLHLIPSAKKLRLAGIKFRPRNAQSYLDVKFKNGVLEIPSLTIDDFTSSVFLNFVAFEQCYSHCTKHFTTYATFMGCLINTPADSELLRDYKIVENYFGTDEEASRFFINVGKDVAFDIHRSYLSGLFEDVNEYCRNNWHVWLAEFKHTYFASPWSLVSALAAAILLIFTMIQAFFAIYAYVRPPHN